MTEAHVPPRAVGNRAPLRERAAWVINHQGLASLGSWQPGGLSVHGLCRDCNLLTSGKADPAYIDFHQRVALAMSSRLIVRRAANDVPPVRVAPGLVARSVLAGMFAINDQLQSHFPGVARDLCEADPDLRLPDDLVLRLALHVGGYSRIGGPVGYMRVLTVREFHMPFAEIWYPPLAWVLRSSRGVEQQLGNELTSSWSDVSEWVRYSSDFMCDLRLLLRSVPVAQMPRFGHDEWVVLTGTSMTALEGRPKGG